MIVRKKDEQEVIKVNDLVNKIDRMNRAEFDSESDVLFKEQPFVITLIIGSRYDYEMQELEEISKIYFLIWKYFKNKKQVLNKKITEKEFETILTRNIHMLKYVEGEDDECVKSDIIASDLEHIKSKVLYSRIIVQLDIIPVLNKMDGEVKGKLLLGMKSLIECFEKRYYA